MLRKSILVVALIGCGATAAPSNSQTGPSDSIAARDHEREAEARWFIVGVDNESMYLVDRKTLQHRSAVRTGWTMAINFAAGKIVQRGAIRQSWNCSHRSVTTLTIQTYEDRKSTRLNSSH